MQIRKAQVTDIPRLIPLIKLFHQETLSQFGFGWDNLSIARTIETFIQHHIGLVVEEKDEIIGVIGGAVTPSFTDYRQRIFIESIWYVNPGYRGLAQGVELLKLVEEYCRRLKINKIIMVGMHDHNHEKLDLFYKRMGFRILESQYMKDLYDAN